MYIDILYVTKVAAAIVTGMIYLTVCILGIFMLFCWLLFFQNQLFRKILSGILSVSNSLDPDQTDILFAKVSSKRHLEIKR